MFECSYKFEEKDSIICAKYVYKSQKRKQDKVIAILIPILMVGMIAMLIYDIAVSRSVVWDIVLLVALAVLEVMYAIIPVMLVNSQKKAYRKQNLQDMDYLKIEIKDNLCTETMVKDGKSEMQNVHNLKSLTSYLEDGERIVLVFNKIEFVCIRKANLVGDLDKFKAYLEKAMSKSNNGKK